uniref:Integrase core domain-containing protein n=1 Tax=Clytia hemisphaerica TaxID=252671 RepID=A0A7M5TW25_9CNID
MTLKVRQKHELKVPRNVVYACMVNVDYENVKKRALNQNGRKKREGRYTTAGVDSLLSIDGHDKLMGYQNSTFPIAVYGMLDQASRKILILRCWTTNSNPDVVGHWYLELLKESKILPGSMRCDRGTETGKLVTIHGYLRAQVGDLTDPVDSIIYGTSTTNQIERWWRELHERLEKNIKKDLNALLAENLYNPHDQIDRDLLAFIMVPCVQRELDEFKDIVWNTHRIRRQKHTLLPDGIPNHIYQFPEKYDLQQCGKTFKLSLVF